MTALQIVPEDLVPCPMCKGAGEYLTRVVDHETNVASPLPCPACRATGEVPASAVRDCLGCGVRTWSDSPCDCADPAAPEDLRDDAAYDVVRELATIGDVR